MEEIHIVDDVLWPIHAVIQDGHENNDFAGGPGAGRATRTVIPEYGGFKGALHVSCRDRIIDITIDAHLEIECITVISIRDDQEDVLKLLLDSAKNHNQSIIVVVVRNDLYDVSSDFYNIVPIVYAYTIIAEEFGLRSDPVWVMHMCDHTLYGLQKSEEREEFTIFFNQTIRSTLSMIGTDIIETKPHIQKKKTSKKEKTLIKGSSKTLFSQPASGSLYKI